VRRNCFKMVSASRTVRNGARLRRSSLDTSLDKVCRVNPSYNALSRMLCLLGGQDSDGGGRHRENVYAACRGYVVDLALGDLVVRRRFP
jgi:hypothetical protein